MALDASFELLNTVINADSNGFNAAGNWFNLHRRGLPRNSELVVIIPTSNADRDFTFKLELRVDNSTVFEATRVTFQKAFKGQRVNQISVPLNTERYAAANIDVRVNYSATNHANASNIGTVKAYLSYGEVNLYGREALADNDAVQH